MFDKIKIEDKKTLIVLKHGRIEEQTADVMLNWVGPDMRSGPASFFRIHSKAGMQLFNSVVNYETGIRNMKDSDSFITMPGDLECKAVIHSIMPRSKNQYVMNFRNIMLTLQEYMKSNLCRSIVLYIPEQAEQCMVGIKEFLLDCGLDEVIVMYMSDAEHDKLNDFFTKLVKKPTNIEVFDNMIEKLLIFLGSKRRIPQYIENFLWNNKKVDKTLEVIAEKQ